MVGWASARDLQQSTSDPNVLGKQVCGTVYALASTCPPLPTVHEACPILNTLCRDFTALYNLCKAIPAFN